ncbi:hypothetical protein MMC29_005566 [Sticta canariensis]|nr:hypothetical protein [Sticta canariensis]
MVSFLFVPIVVHMVVWATINLFEKGVDLFLSLAFTLLVLKPFRKITLDKDRPLVDHGRIACEAAFYPSQTNISVMDANRLIQMERRRDDRISVIEKGRRRQPRQKHFDKVQHHQGLTSPTPLRHQDLDPISSKAQPKRAESPSPKGVDVALPVVQSTPGSPDVGSIDLATPFKDTSPLPLPHLDLDPISSKAEPKRAESPSPKGMDDALPVVLSSPGSPDVGSIDLGSHQPKRAESPSPKDMDNALPVALSSPGSPDVGSIDLGSLQPKRAESLSPKGVDVALPVVLSSPGSPDVGSIDLASPSKDTSLRHLDLDPMSSKTPLERVESPSPKGMDVALPVVLSSPGSSDVGSIDLASSSKDTSPLPLPHLDLDPISSKTQPKRAESPSLKGVDVALPVLSSPGSSDVGSIDLASSSKNTSPLPAIDPETKRRNEAFHVYMELVNELWEPLEGIEPPPGFGSKYEYFQFMGFKL